MYATRGVTTVESRISMKYGVSGGGLFYCLYKLIKLF